MTEKKFNITSHYEKIADLNNSVREFLSSQNVEQHICNAVEISLTEALNNVIKHSYQNSDSKHIEVVISKNTNLIEIAIIDEGEPRKNLEIKELDFDPHDIMNLPESGMGLYIIKQLMDELNYYSRNGKNYFTLKKWIY